jgi:hypothetical protein
VRLESPTIHHGRHTLITPALADRRTLAEIRDPSSSTVSSKQIAEVGQASEAQLAVDGETQSDAQE